MKRDLKPVENVKDQHGVNHKILQTVHFLKHMTDTTCCVQNALLVQCVE
jgi:hypothetical protein